jgi:hypothetical protein
MLDDKLRLMLEAANRLTSDDIDRLRTGHPIVPITPCTI